MDLYKNVSWVVAFTCRDTTWGFKPMGWTSLNNMTIQYNTTTQDRQNNMGGQSRAVRWSKKGGPKEKRREWSMWSTQQEPQWSFHPWTHTYTYQLIDLLIK